MECIGWKSCFGIIKTKTNLIEIKELRFKCYKS